MHIRRATEADFVSMWSIFHAVVATGDTYVFGANTGREEAHVYWLGPDIATYVAEIKGNIVGFYKVIPNQRDLGAHVANASFMVSPSAHGKGVGKAMGQHCLFEAKKAGFLALQFNFVVSTNKGAITLWKKLGFAIVGTLPKVFNHQQLGFVDAHVMHRFLDDIVVE
jgi:L-amino acid N-acyltransferase YncA